MRDLSAAEGAPAQAEEQTLNQQAPQAEAETAQSTKEEVPFTDSDAPLMEVEDEMAQAAQEAEEAAKPLTTEQLIAEATDILAMDGADIQRDRLSRLRQQFASLRKIEIDEARDAWAQDGNAPEDFAVGESEQEKIFNGLVAQIRDKKNAWAEEQEQARRDNLKAKADIVEQINALAEDTDNVNRTFPLYLDLQERFNTIGEVPATEETAIWKKFQEAREHYSDNLKINKELRDYDFKKNLDSKILLIEQAVALDIEEDVIAAFRRLQELHDKWRQIGPVAKELREEIWQKFKDASAVINKKYQAFFEERKAKEAANEAAKAELCEKAEAVDINAINSFVGWEEATKQILELQNEWRTVGFASRKANNALFARFREACDKFFSAKAAYFKKVKEEYAANLAKKTALAERAEALKDSTEWRKATDEFVAMQKEWKTIGAVPKKYSDAVWKRFLAACDSFFDKKKEATSGQRTAEHANLVAKKELIEALKAIDATEDGAIDKLHELQDKWQEIGHVPFKDKDKVNDAYRAAVNELRRTLNVNENRARMDRFESNLSQMEGDKAKLSRERERMARTLESRRIEIRTYENNLGFLTSKSKSGESMVNEFRRKIDRLKEEIASIEERIRMVDSKMK
ncbi:MAG: DUF349 domain-containing protein [Clostridium sp.]|nr:DUF349 domain-containing protein [Clostridium sp.]